MARAILKTGYRCNNRCVFCHSAALRRIPELGTGALLARLREAREAGFDGVVLSGGEPTLRRDLLRVAHRARELGLGFGLITNGRVLSYRDRCDALAATGLEYAYVSIHSADAVTHDALTGVPGAHAQTLEGIRNLSRHAGVQLTANAVLLTRTLGGLRDLVSLLGSLPRVRMKLSTVEPRGAMREHPEEVPGVEAAAAAVRDALEHGLRLGLPRERLAWDGLPFCLMEGWTDRFADLFTDGITAL
ncbi:MAG: radical SAM protein, partial [Deltaproteobacteria bacterium]|nr:radical SAM protein [Deltaproteobacteria bacterium]